MARVHHCYRGPSAFPLCVVLALLLCVTARAQTGGISGRVVVDNHGAFESPNERIRILLKGPYEARSLWSNPDGTFILRGLRVGKWDVRVAHQNYNQPSSASALVESDTLTTISPNPILLKRFKPAPPTNSGDTNSLGTISGQVLVQNGDKLEEPGVKIRILARGAYESRSVFTSENGKFSINGFKGRCKLNIMQNGFRQREEIYADVDVPVTIIVETDKTKRQGQDR